MVNDVMWVNGHSLLGRLSQSFLRAVGDNLGRLADAGEAVPGLRLAMEWTASESVGFLDVRTVVMVAVFPSVGDRDRAQAEFGSIIRRGHGVPLDVSRVSVVMTTLDADGEEVAL